MKGKNMAEQIGLKMARAYPEQIQAMREWFYALETMLESDADAEDVGRFVQRSFGTKRIGEYERILFGYETMFENACDPSLSYLDFKPEIKAALAQE